VLNTRNDDDTLLQPLNPSNHDTRLNGLEKNKSINNSSGNSKNKKYDPINLIAINNVGPQLIPSDSMFMRLSKNKSIKPSKINTLLSTIRKENLINEYDSLINDYIFNIPSVSHYDKKNYSSKSIINNVGSNSSSNSINNNNNNNNNKVKEVKPVIDSNNNKKDNWKPICRNSIIYLQNEESNTKAKNNFKSWVISNFEHEWEDQPWISIKCPNYDELEEEETDYYQHSISVKRKSHSNSNIENLPLKVAYLSHTIQHIYRNSNNFLEGKTNLYEFPTVTHEVLEEIICYLYYEWFSQYYDDKDQDCYMVTTNDYNHDLDIPKYIKDFKFVPNYDYVFLLIEAALYFDLSKLIDICADFIAKIFDDVDSFYGLPVQLIKHIIKRLNIHQCLHAQQLLEKEKN
jgi:hypothetical protein